MPELPEVETTRRGIAPHLQHQIIQDTIVRDARLRWPIAPDLDARLRGQRIHAIRRRAKYLIIELDEGALLIHLGMSGKLRILDAHAAVQKHDHADIVLQTGQCLRLNDPRRFGALLWTPDWTQHPLLKDLGPEPLSDTFTGAYLHQHAAGRRQAVKSFIMDAHVVVGVGNIYASEALFHAGIHPRRQAGRVSHARYERLTQAIRAVLQNAIAQGGTTLRDFSDPHGKPGYFVLSLAVYGRTGQPCNTCGQPIKAMRIGQRNSFFCTHCQA